MLLPPDNALFAVAKNFDPDDFALLPKKQRGGLRSDVATSEFV
jgi:hypothetical protein